MIWKKIPNKFIETTPLNSAVFPIDSNTRYKKKRAQSTGTSLDYRMGGLQPPFLNTCELKPVDTLVDHISSHFSSGVIISQNNG